VNKKYKKPMVTTIKDKCRVCYTCVRECPAKAIRIANGQAEVIAERCIGCGNCVRVCSQNAKQVIGSRDEVSALLKSPEKVTAIIAPSFAAEFHEMDYMKFVGMVRALGFDYVNEVAFGADLVARKTRELLAQSRDQRYIATACPAVFGYVKRYHPDLIDSLAPVVSPMIAEARALRQLYGDDLRIVFIGPCIAKKGEAYSEEVSGEIDEVLTFVELRKIFDEAGLSPEDIQKSDFDPPHGNKGSVFPIGRGLLETANIHEDLIEGDVISASGKSNFIDAIIEFSSGETTARFMDVLCCDGCLMGAGMTTTAPLFRRRALQSNFVRTIIQSREPGEWVYYMEKFHNLDLSRTFTPYDQRISTPDESEIATILARMGKTRPEDELNCGACGYETCREHAIAIYKGLAESEMCLPWSIEKLHDTIGELAVSNEKLADTREALIQSEKMASMGQLAAGIAHEINNPLGVVLMYSHILLDELNVAAEDKDALKMIADHADRAKKIVAGLLHFARENKVILKKVNLEHLVDDCLKGIQLPANIILDKRFGLSDPHTKLDRDQIIQVMTNLINNSITAMPHGGTLTIVITDDDDEVTLKISDTGTGIPEEIVPKIFEPFFTTKKAGEGTGLGLSIIYGIVKMHRGQINVTSNTDPDAGPTGTTFSVTLPKL
jgi:signal transduction histidine kinase/Fe-S-cluster-containing hydrogenase component 2